MKRLDLTIIGPGMIVHDLILPAAFHLQRTGAIGEITVCGTRPESLRSLRNNPDIRAAFPGQGFRAVPDQDSDNPADPELYKQVLAQAEPYQAVIVALPDQLHYRVVMDCLAADQHVLCVKPLTLNQAEGEEIAAEAHRRNLLAAVEYHKRFDRRALIARRRYGRGELGELVMGEAKMIEPYYYHHSNFQNWFTADQTDPFVYVGCHYVDQVAFITGLKPVEVSSAGVLGKFPNGAEAFMWAVGRVRFENGALLSVTSGLGYPDQGAGPNEQGLALFFEKDGQAGLLKHNDQFRGVEYSFMEPLGPGKKRFHYVNPDFFQYIPWEGEGEKPIGYGVDSVTAALLAMGRIETAAEQGGQPGREQAIEEVNQKGLIATAANSGYNELVHEAARISILDNGRPVKIEYQPEPKVGP